MTETETATTRLRRVWRAMAALMLALALLAPSGAAIDVFSLPDYFVSDYDVTATGPISGTATTTFTDLAIGTYDQCSNDDGDGYATGNTGCRWINGNLQGNHSTYAGRD